MTSQPSPFPGLNPPYARGVCQTGRNIPMGAPGLAGPREGTPDERSDPYLDQEHWRQYPPNRHDNEERPKTGAPPEKPDLDFGWFSVPRQVAEQNAAGEGNGSPRIVSPSQGSAVEGQLNGDGDVHMEQLGCPFPPSNPCAPQGHVPQAPPQQQLQQKAQNFEWPLSAIARNQMRPPPPAAAPYDLNLNNQENAGSQQQCGAPPVPPTPLPPLSLAGYGQNARPTYRSWREQWHRSHGAGPSDQLDNNNNSCHGTLDTVSTAPGADPDPEDLPSPGFDDVGAFNNAALDHCLAPADSIEGLQFGPEHDLMEASPEVDLDELHRDSEDIPPRMPARYGRYVETVRRYVPSMVVAWNDDKQETDQEAAPLSKGSDLVNSLRAKVSAVISSLKCWQTTFRGLIARKPVPYRRFSPKQENQKCEVSAES